MVDATIPTSANSVDTERNQIALEAAYEIEVMSDLIRRESAELPDGMKYLFRGLAIRLKELSGVVMSAIGDEAESTAEIACRLRGEFMGEDHG